MRHKTLRDLISLFFVLVSFFHSAFCFAETVKISGHLAYPPVMYRYGESIEGVGADFLRAVFKELGITVESKYVGNWARTWLEFKNGKIDILTGCYVNDERRLFAEFTTNYLVSDPMMVFVRKGNEFRFDKWEDLVGKKGGNTLGDSQGEKFDAFKQKYLNIELVSNRIQNYQKLKAGRIDYAIDGFYPARILFTKNGLEEKFVPLKTPLQTEYIYIAISKKSRFLKYLPYIDRALLKMRKDGTIDRLVDKHIEMALEIKRDN